MNRKALLALVALAAVGVLAWDLLRAPGAALRAEAPAASAARVAPSPSGSGPAMPAPAVAGATAPAAVNFLRPASVNLGTSSPLARSFSETPVLKPLYDRLKGTAEGETPEGQFFLYRILRACATVADRKGSGPRPTPAAQLEERRQQIAAELPESDPRRAQRLAAFDKVTADQCAGMAGVTVTESELNQLLRNALAGGDPKARAWQLEQEMWQERRAAGAAGRGGPTLGDAQVAGLREAFASRDPEAMVIAGRVLANNFRDMTVRIGPDQEVIDQRAFSQAAILLACEYGYACGENNTRVLAACAYQGRCGVATLPDYLFYYGVSPYESQLLDRYRTILRQAVDSGDWSAITIQRGPRANPVHGSPIGSFGR